jgi:glycerophosphoryl diester phosphodiesterase
MNTILVVNWLNIISILRKSLGRIFVIQLVYAGLGFALISPLLGIFGQFLLHLSGREALADMDILFFLLTPYGIIALIIFSSLLITILAFELATILVLCAASHQFSEVSPLAALVFVARRSAKLFLFAIHLIGRILLIILPFLAVAGVIGWYLLTEYDINYYLSQKPPAYIVSVLLIALVLFVMSVCLAGRLIAWSLALPLLLIGEVPPAQAFRSSSETIRGNRQAVLKILLYWFVSATLLGTVVFTALQWTGSLVLPYFYSSVNILILVLGGLVALMALAQLLVTTITTGSLGAILVIMYEQLAGSVSIDPFSPSLQAEKLRRKPGLITLFACAVLLSAGGGWWLINDIQAKDDIDIIAHRGAAGSAPENTMAAIRRAIADGADWIEIDVQESRDGQIVVIHDSDFMKIGGVNLKIWEGSLQEMQEIDIGSWFDQSFSAERIPTLNEVLEEARDKSRVLIELKYYGHDEQLEQRVIDIVEQSGMVEQTALMSLKYGGTQKVRSLRPEWKVGLLSATAVGNLAGLEVDFLAVNSGMASPAFIKSTQRAGKDVLVWTVNDPLTMFQMASRGVDGIITDEPAMGLEVLQERAELNSIERLVLHAAMLLDQPLPLKKYRDQSP